MAKKKKVPYYAKDFKNHKVIIFDGTDTISEHPVYCIDNGSIETDEDILPIENFTKVYNESTGGFTYMSYVPALSKVESENVKKLRRSAALNNMMEFETDKSLDMMKVVPYLIAIVAIMF